MHKYSSFKVKILSVLSQRNLFAKKETNCNGAFNAESSVNKWNTGRY